MWLFESDKLHMRVADSCVGCVHNWQLIALEDRFERVGTIVLVHFSARYSREELAAIIDRKVPASFRSKLRIGR